MFKGRISGILLGSYWRGRYLLLKHYKHRVLSESHGCIVTRYSALLIELRRHATENNGGGLPSEILAHLEHGQEDVERAVAIHHSHGYKKKEKQC